MRSLVTIQKLAKIDPIEGKDRIGYASFESVGWHCIVGKSEFNVGDLCVYAEPDTLFPPKPEFEFLRKRCWNEKWQGHRIMMMKMSGLVSEGIVLPISLLPAGDYKEGQDVTDLVGARKYDPEIQEEMKEPVKHNWLMTKLLRIKWFRDLLYPKVETGSWPTFFPGKTDETRVASIPWIIDELKDEYLYVTEKLDGQSFSAALHKGKLYICSRNQWYKKPTNNNFWEIAEKYNLKHALKKINKEHGEVVIQGEICGPGIQSNKYGFDSKRLFIFNAWSVKERKYLSQLQLRLLCIDLNIDMVPILEAGKINKTVDEWTEYSKGYSKYGENVLREGIVVRSISNIRGKDKTGPVLGFKVINPDFMIKWNL